MIKYTNTGKNRGEPPKLPPAHAKTGPPQTNNKKGEQCARKRGTVRQKKRSRCATAEELLVITPSLDENGKMKYAYHLSNTHPDTPLEELAHVVKAEHRIEDCIKRAKSEAGLSDYELRTWAGCRHHQTLSHIAPWFLIKEPRRGNKIYPGVDGATGSRFAGSAVATRVRSHISRLADALCQAQKRTQRTGPLSSFQTT